MSYKKQKQLPWKLPSIETQTDFIDDYFSLLEEAKEWKISILFYDPVHQLHNSVAWKCRIEKWTEHFLRSNTGRKRLTAMWWFDPIKLEFHWIIIDDYCDTETTKYTLREIRKWYPDKQPIFIFLDNAAYNRAYEVQDYAESIGIVLCFLPPYSPNLNLIERLRKFMKKMLVKNRYYETFSEFRKEFISFFTNLKKYSQELKRIFDHNLNILKAV